MAFLRDLFGKSAPAGDGGSVAHLRLADPSHPARDLIDRAAAIADQCVQVLATGDRSAMQASFAPEQRDQALAALDEAAARCPEDLDLLVAKADLLHAAAQFKTAEEILDQVLARDPDHFEARNWKDHWDHWMNALRFPRWDQAETVIHPVMAAHLTHGHRVQLVRDGLQKAAAIVVGIQGPPLPAATQVKLLWMLSETPHGPLVAYYLRMIEPDDADTTEAFLPIFAPGQYSPLEGTLLIQQAAFTPYCFVVLIGSSGEVLLNRRVTYSASVQNSLRQIAANVRDRGAYLPQANFQSAMQWHMDHVDLKDLKFE